MREEEGLREHSSLLTHQHKPFRRCCCKLDLSLKLRNNFTFVLQCPFNKVLGTLIIYIVKWKEKLAHGILRLLI